MAFVNKTQRFQQDQKATQNLGPGNYLGPSQYQLKKAYAPFSTTGPKLQTFETQKPQKLNAQTPGPGSYNVVKDLFNEKVLVSNLSEDIKIIEVPKESAIFKSSTKRMVKNTIDPHIQTPGPGSYQNQYTSEYSQDQKKFQNKQTLDENKSKRNIIEDIMKVNKYQSIPSIPGVKQAYGYTENERNELETNKNPLISHSGFPMNSVGPGHYQIKSNFSKNQTKGPGWSKSKVNRMAKKITKSDMMLGPGIYNVNANLNPLYKYKPSSCFASKSFRNQPNSAIGNQHIINKYQSYALQLSQDSEQQEVVKPEQLNQGTPGPGQYYPEKVINSMKLTQKPQKYELQFFGSSSVRFKSPQSALTSSVGPGYYNENSQVYNSSHTQKPRKHIPFSSEQERFEELANWKQNPGPGSYNPKNQIEDQLINKMQQGYKGQFGSSEERFKENEMETPGPGAYNKEEVKQDYEYVPMQRYDPNYFFKQSTNPKHSDRTSFIPKRNAPPIGVYDQDFYDISKKVAKHQEIDQSLITRAEGIGFNSSEQRFKKFDKEKNNDLEKQLFEEQQQEQQQQQDAINNKFKSNIQGLGFGNKDQRFKYTKKQKNQPGPGQYYDPHQNLWNKKTFNIEFTGIK